MQYAPIADLDRQVALDVLDNDIWEVDGEWRERVYEPFADGYMSSERRLLPYSGLTEATFELREEIFRRTGIQLVTPPMEPVKMCHEALGLNGAARWRPSKALIERLEQSHWEEDGRWTVPLRDVVSGPYGRIEAAHIYVLHHSCAFYPMYIGQTKNGVKRRIRQHLSAKTIIGRALASDRPRFTEWTLEVIAIRSHGYNSLNAAETYFIQEYKPIYNIAKVIPL